MPDITMCKGQSETATCPMRENCYRYTANPTPYWQSWFVGAPFVKVHDSVSCAHFWQVESKSQYKRLEEQNK